jgi:hypothetical protein
MFNIPASFWIRFVIVLGSTTALVSFLMQQGTGSDGSYSLFTLHPVLMIVSFSLLMSEGVNHYRLSTMSIEAARMSHGAIFGLTTVLAFSSLIIILVNKSNIKHDLTPHTTHAIFGAVTLFLLFYQAASGVSKLRWLWKTNNKIYSNHGRLGIYVIYTMGFITMLLGFYQVEVGQSFWIAVMGLSSVYAVMIWHFIKSKRTVVDDMYLHIASDELDGMADIDGGIEMNFS